jgi:large subunit ribosomal protein L21
MTQPHTSRYAIIRAGGKQYTAHQGQKLRIDKMDAEVGSEIVLREVLFLGGQGDSSAVAGTPLVQNAEVKGRVVGHTKGKKVIVFKKTNRTGYKKKQGHRQQYTEILVESIVG